MVRKYQSLPTAAGPRSLGKPATTQAAVEVHLIEPVCRDRVTHRLENVIERAAFDKPDALGVPGCGHRIGLGSSAASTGTKRAVVRSRVCPEANTATAKINTDIFQMDALILSLPSKTATSSRTRNSCIATKPQTRDFTANEYSGVARVCKWETLRFRNSNFGIRNFHCNSLPT